MHFKVFLDQENVLTGQIFFPDALSEYLYLNAPAYGREATRDTINGNDHIAQSATRASFASVKEEDAVYLVQLIVGVNPDARSASRRGRGAPPPGPPPGGPGRPPDSPSGETGRRNLVPGPDE